MNHLVIIFFVVIVKVIFFVCFFKNSVNWREWTWIDMNVRWFLVITTWISVKASWSLVNHKWLYVICNDHGVNCCELWWLRVSQRESWWFTWNWVKERGSLAERERYSQTRILNSASCDSSCFTLTHRKSSQFTMIHSVIIGNHRWSHMIHRWSWWFMELSQIFMPWSQEIILLSHQFTKF